MKTRANTVTDQTTATAPSQFNPPERAVNRPKSRCRAFPMPPDQSDSTYPEPNAHISPSDDLMHQTRQRAPMVARTAGRTSHAHGIAMPPINFPPPPESSPGAPSLPNESASRLCQSNILPPQTRVNNIPIRKGSETYACPDPAKPARPCAPSISEKKVLTRVHYPSSHGHYPGTRSSPGVPHVRASDDQDRRLPGTDPSCRPYALYSSPVRPVRYPGNEDTHASLV